MTPPRRAAAATVATGLVATGLALAACGDGAADDPGTAAGAAPPATGAVGIEGYEPVLSTDFPDPDLLLVEGTYYAYATNDGAHNVQVATSTDLEQWQELPTDALPDLPQWVTPGKTWAPEVRQLRGGPAEGSFVMYTTTTNFDPALQCIAVAVADAPEGPFTVVGDGMLVCPEDEGGAIDAATFRDLEGTLYLLWKNDGNCCGLPTWIYAAPLSDDGLTLAGEPTRLITQDQPWEGDLVEAPTIVEQDGVYVLLYSSNDYGGADYTIGYATAPAVTGPWTKSPDPLLTTDGTGGAVIGPGGQDVVSAPGSPEGADDRLVLHGWDTAITRRAMYVLPLEWDGATPRVSP